MMLQSRFLSRWGAAFGIDGEFLKEVVNGIVT